MWKQIYDETWRIERDFFYDPHYHGLDLDKAKKKYAPYLDRHRSREELTYLFQECLGEMTVGHMFVGGGEQPEPKKVKGGLLGADYTTGERPLSHRQGLRRRELEPGSAGAADAAGRQREGRRVPPRRERPRPARAPTTSTAVFEEHRGQAGGAQGRSERQTAPAHATSRWCRSTAKRTCASCAWIEDNRRRVDEATGGRVAYVYVPNTAGAATRASTATSSHRSARRRRSSTSASTKAASSPTTSSTTCGVRC